MPLVRTHMTAPTSLYQHVPMLSPEEAAGLVEQAIVYRPERIATRLGVFAEVLHAVAPKVSHVIMNTAFRMFPDSGAARGMDEAGSPPASAPTPDQVAFMQVMRGIHL